MKAVRYNCYRSLGMLTCKEGFLNTQIEGWCLCCCSAIPQHSVTKRSQGEPIRTQRGD